MPSFLGVPFSIGTQPINAAQFVVTDYLPVAVVAVVLIALATALIVSVRRRDID